MDLETAVKFAQLGFVVAQALVIVFMLVMRGSFASKTEVQAAHTHADNAHRRLDVLDERLRGFPGYDVTNELRDDFAEMSKSQAETTTELRMLREQLRSIDEFLRNHR